jgi:hypothetical protein
MIRTIPNPLARLPRLFSPVRRMLLVGAFLSLALTVSAQQDGGLDRGRIPPPNERVQETLIRDVRVTTAVPSAAETQAIFGANLYASNIQPVWIQVENLSEENLFFLPVGLDPAYFTPIETGYRRENRILNLNSSANRNIYDSSMRLRVEAGDIRSGYVFSRVDEGTKSFNVDVFGDDGRHYLMTFFVPVPGLRIDHYNVDWANLYSEDEIREVDRDGLVDALQSLACCTTDKSGEDHGDPLNIAVVGDLKDVYYAFMRAGWDETETIYRTSLLKTLGSALTGNEYRYSPVSALYVFGRAQDVALQKARADIHQRNHLRLWMAPIRYQGLPVWIGQISRDIGVRFTWRTITTHKIDPDVDETREYLVEDLAYAQSLAGLGYVTGVGAAPYDQPRGNLTGDPYFTDGLRVVLFLSDEPVNISEIQVFDLGSRPD